MSKHHFFTLALRARPSMNSNGLQK